MDSRPLSGAKAGPNTSSAPQPQPAENPKTRALRALEPRLMDTARMIDHLVFMVQHKLHEGSWSEFLTHYQLFQTKYAAVPMLHQLTCFLHSPYVIHTPCSPTLHLAYLSAFP